MRLHIGAESYPCTGRPRFTDPVRFTLPGDKPDVAALGNTLTLRADGGGELRSVDISGMVRRYFEGDTLVCTAAPEPVPVEPVEEEPSIEDDIIAQTLQNTAEIAILSAALGMGGEI